MALKDLMELSGNKRSGASDEITEERVLAQIDNLRNLISFFREYPDIFVDFIKGEDCNFKFFFYQRIFLRNIMRHRITYSTFPRAYSKSFLTMLSLMLKAVLFPGAHLFVTTGGKEQASSITCSKIDEICKLIPALGNEIDNGRGKTRRTKEDVEFVFKSGSKINILAATQASRGQRRTGGAMEEAILINGDILNEVIIPTMNVDRLLPDGSRSLTEVANKSQTFITTAGWKNTFAYDKLIEILICSIIEPDVYMISGGTYKTPVVEGLLSKDFVAELRLQGTFSTESFDREYNSKWSGDVENAYFPSEQIDKSRVLLQPEYEYSGRSSKTAYYTIGVDVGRHGCTSEAAIVKTTPAAGMSIKSVVNLVPLGVEHFEDQAIAIKKLFFKYKARRVVIDGNGLGTGLIDYMVKTQIDPETGDELPPFGVDNDEKGDYKKYKTPTTIPNAIYIVKANVPINSEAYTYLKTEFLNNHIKMLIDVNSAKLKLMSTKLGQNYTPEQRAEYLMPFTYTNALKEQMMNLVRDNEDGVNVILKRKAKKIPKDRFSALLYAFYYIKQVEESKNKRKNGKRFASSMLFS